MEIRKLEGEHAVQQLDGSTMVLISNMTGWDLME